MEIEVKSSLQVDSDTWRCYVTSFNDVFKKNYQKGCFNQKYYNSVDGESYHVFLKENDKIVGACSSIPFEYFIEDEIYRIGLMVDVFIKKEFRKDPLMLYKMYKKLKNVLIEKGISCTIAVPNDNSYSYWKNIVKWKDIGDIPYYVLPVRLGTILDSKYRLIFNFFSRLYCNIFLYFPLKKSIQKKSTIELKRADDFENHRYYKFHRRVEFDSVIFHYRMINEDGIKTCYLIDFYNVENEKKRDRKSLNLAVKFILNNYSNLDLIVFIGTKIISQSMLLKLPKDNEPKKLHLTYDNFSLNESNEKLISDLKNWDFGLVNYDVR